MGDCEGVLLELRKCLFWGGYKIWKTRKRLVAQYWKSIPDTNKKNAKSMSSCKNPFHFWAKVIDLSKQRLTRCSCSRVTQITSYFHDIRTLLERHLPHLT